jgi:hemerythrin-like domain-containing protein
MEAPMSRTQRYRDQHGALLRLAGELIAELDPDHLSRNAFDIRLKLSTFMGSLKVHLAAEDQSLYPSLLSHSNPEIQAKAKRFTEEMGSLNSVVSEYDKRWEHASEINARPSDFIDGTRRLLDSLAERIRREDEDLYALVDAD